MNNRAVTTGGIVVIILGFLVILLVVTGPLKVGYDYAKEKFFGEHSIFSSLAPSREAEFQPYTGQIQLSSEEVIVDNSVKALICAVNSLALGKPGWLEKNVCPEGFTFPGMPKKESTIKAVGKALFGLTGAVTADKCTGALYGQSCVECTTLESGMKVIMLDGYASNARSQLIDETIDCWKNFQISGNKNVYCAKAIIPNADSSWVINEADFREQLNNQPGIGDDLAGYSLLGQDWLGHSSKNYKWLLPSPLFVNIAPIYICAKTKSAWGGTDMEDKIVLTFNQADCYVTEAPPEKEFKCSVKDFELPQELGSSILPADLAQEIMAQFTDPQYLVYYESFPRGEAAAWQINPGSFVIDVVLFGSVMNVIPAVGMYGGKILSAGKGLASRSVNKILGRSVQKETAEQLMKKAGVQITKDMSEASLREFLSSLSPEGYATLMRSERLYTELYSSLSGRLPEEFESLRYGIFRQYSVYKSAGKNNDAIVSLLSKDIDTGAFGPKLIPEDRAAISKAIDSFVRNPLSDVEMESLKKSVSVKQFFVKNLLNDAGDGIDAKAFDDLFKNLVSTKTISALSDEASEQLVKRSADIAEAGIVDLSKPGTDIWRSSVLGPAVVRDLEKVAVEIEQSSGDAFQRFFMGVTAAEVGESVAEAGGKAAVAKAALSRYNPFYISIRGKDVLVPRQLLLHSVTSVGGTLVKAPVAGAAMVYDAAYVTLWRPRAVRYSLAIALGMANAQADASNEKYRFRGGDSIVLQKPYLYEKNKVYSLSKSTSDYFLSLFKFDKGSKGYSRFFLASPCKADVILAKTQCSCEIKTGDYLMKSNWQPVQPESLNLSLPGSREKINLFEKEFKANQREFENACAGRSVSGWSKADMARFMNKCAETLSKTSEVYSRFTKEYYDKAYLPAFKFLKDNNLFEAADELIVAHKPYQMYLALPVLAGRIEMRSEFASLRNDPNFGLFKFFVSPIDPYDVEDTNQRLYYALLDVTYPLMVDSYDSVRRRLLDYTEFVEILDSGLYEQSGKIWDYPNLYGLLLRRFPGQKTGAGTLISMAANNTFLNYYLVRDDKKGIVDISNVAKICEFSDKKNIINVFERYDVDKARVSVPCFNTQVSLAQGYNNGHNYCYTGDKSYIANLKWILTGVAVCIDVAAGIAGFGIGEIPVAILTGTASAWAGHELDKRQWWPNH